MKQESTGTLEISKGERRVSCLSICYLCGIQVIVLVTRLNCLVAETMVAGQADLKLNVRNFSLLKSLETIYVIFGDRLIKDVHLRT